eukprot:g5840.t1
MKNLNLFLPVLLINSLVVGNTRGPAKHRLEVTISDKGDTSTLVVHENETPREAVRLFAIDHGLWSQDKQQLLDHLCGPYGLQCNGETHIWSVKDFLANRDAVASGEGGAGSAGPDADSDVVRHKLAEWNRNRNSSRFNSNGKRPKVGKLFYVDPPNSLLWEGPKPVLVRATEINNLELFVVDKAVPQRVAIEWHRELDHAPFTRTESDTQFAASKKIQAFKAEFSVERMLNAPIYWRIQRIVEQLFPNEEFTPNRIYCNSCHYGDIYFTHRDYSSSPKHVSVIYYANSEWPHEWQGETIFYSDTDDTDAMLAITPRPGRLAIFRGTIPHRSAEPSRLCLISRYTWVFKFTSATRKNVIRDL